MRKMCLALLLVFSVGLVSWAAPVKTVPKEVLELYGDLVKVMGTLVKDLDKASTAKAVAKAFNAATQLMAGKKIAARYQAMKVKYPEFFGDSDNDAVIVDASYPKEWAKLYGEYAAAFEKYGSSMANLFQFAADEEVEKAMTAFGDEMGKMEGGE